MSSEWDYTKALEADPFKEERNGEEQGGVNGEAKDDGASDEPTPSKFNWPDPLPDEAFHGPLGEAVRLIGPHSEADPAALLVQSLVGFGSLIGRRPYFMTDGARQFTNLFAVIVGRTAKARKGTSWNQTFRILRQVEEEWASRVMSGASTGEGIIWAAVRDAIRERSPIKEKGRIIGYEEIESDPGISDKRLFNFEAEFARVLKVMERETNTLSPVLRDAFDTGDLATLTKKQAARATGAHVSFVAHVTKDEIRRLVNSTEAGNGYLNRHLFVCSARSKLLPDGGAIGTVDFSGVIKRLETAVKNSRICGEMKRDPEARAMWHEVYGELSEGKPGMFGAITSRADVLAVRLSMVFALADNSSVIRAAHLKAALAVLTYSENSVRFVFGDAIGDETADEILIQLRARRDGMTRTEVRDYFQRNRSAEEIGRALGVLQEHGLAKFERQRESPDSPRPTERWFAVKAYQAQGS